MKYLNQYRHTLASRIFWSVILALAVCSCFYFIFLNYIKWTENPYIIRVTEKWSHINNIPFPAVTVCPESKSKRNLVNVTDGFHKIANKSQPFDLPDEMRVTFFEVTILDNFQIFQIITTRSFITCLRPTFIFVHKFIK